LKGVSSDIVLPDNLEYLKVREKDDPDALPWDEITKASYSNWMSVYDLKTIQRLSNDRLANDVAFKLIKENTDWLSKQNDKQYSLQIDKYRKEQKMIRATLRQIDALTKLSGDLTVSPLSNETDRWADDKNKQERFNQWIKGLQKDIYLDQAVKVVNDIIGQQNLAKAKTGEEPKKAF